MNQRDDRPARTAGPDNRDPRSAGPPPPPVAALSTDELVAAGLDLARGVGELARRLRAAYSTGRRGRDDERPVARRELTYRDAVAFFAENQRRSGGAKAGAIVRERAEAPPSGRSAAPEKMIIRLVFLDAQAEPLAAAPAASYLVEHIDRELDRAFGRHDVIIVS
ncbi:hypothetical protein [Parafrankia discariae]|uniref:hypothetical protein n=1 Tax=Parafrankia discariae TaxID=365528 RepID=UPI00035C34CD|nr:hypothetical protein [Parafrankia discariae]